MSFQTTRRAILISAIVLLGLAGCGKKQDAAAPPPPVPVTVATAAEKTVPVQVRAIGTVEAYSTVAIKPQISGQLVGIHFSEGDDVKKGQLLFTIDQRPFEVALQQAMANLARDKATAANNRIQAQRYQKLFEEGVASSQQRDLAVSEADAFDAVVRGDEAAIAQASLNLEYCTIVSPMDGRTGSLMVHVGNLVKANDVPILLMLNQITPTYVNFSLPEQYLAEVKKYRGEGTLRVEAYVTPPATGSTAGVLPAGGTSPLVATPEALGIHTGVPEAGTVSFVDNAVDTATGTIRLKAVFQNAQRRLWPGQFVDVILTLAQRPRATVVPTQALQSGQSGQFVFVVKPDNTVESRNVTVGLTVGNETVIEKGIRPGEVVVTDGQLRLVPGSHIRVKG